MDVSEEEIDFEPASGVNADIEAMNVKKAEREKRKSMEFEKDKSKSEEEEAGQNKRRISEVASTGVPEHPGELLKLQ